MVTLNDSPLFMVTCSPALRWVIPLWLMILPWLSTTLAIKAILPLAVIVPWFVIVPVPFRLYFVPSILSMSSVDATSPPTLTFASLENSMPFGLMRNTCPLAFSLP